MANSVHNGLRQEHRQHQTMTPRLQQAVRLLQLSSLDFALEVDRAMSANPFLEPDEPDQDAGEVAVDPRDEQLLTTLTEPAPAEIPGEPASAGEWESSLWSQHHGSSSPSRASSDGEFDALSLAAAEDSLRDHLRGQARLLTASERDHALMDTIIEALDDDGYLRVDMEELKALAGVEPAPDDDEMTVALRLVQSLEPGIGARDLRECLLLQLKTQHREAEYQAQDCALHCLAERIVQEALPRVALSDLPGVARIVGASVPAVERAIEAIRRLQPRPGWRYGAADTRFITPDVVARKVRDEWLVALNPDVVPRVRLNRIYADLFRSHRDSSHADLAAQLQEARWTVRNVEQRFSTIVRVAQAIAKRQRYFLDYGELAMKPLGLKEIADELGLHESTVSRVTNNKYMATPLGVFELKYFFSRALPTSSGGNASTTSIRGAIKEMIDEENPAKPLSDATIARLLSRQGLQVARRTVTKYRQMMKLPSYESRRRGPRAGAERPVPETRRSAATAAAATSASDVEADDAQTDEVLHA